MVSAAAVTDWGEDESPEEITSRQARWQRLAVAAVKQSLRHAGCCARSPALPCVAPHSPAACRTHSLTINPPIELGELVSAMQAAPLSLVAAAGGQPLLQALPSVAGQIQAASQADAEPALLIVGPEGDFTGVPALLQLHRAATQLLKLVLSCRRGACRARGCGRHTCGLGAAALARGDRQPGLADGCHAVLGPCSVRLVYVIASLPEQDRHVWGQGGLLRHSRTRQLDWLQSCQGLRKDSHSCSEAVAGCSSATVTPSIELQPGIAKNGQTSIGEGRLPERPQAQRRRPREQRSGGERTGETDQRFPSNLAAG